MANWTKVLDVAGGNVVKDFANGNASGRQLERAVKFTDAAGEVRQLLRTRGVHGTRELARKALSRRR